MAATFDPTLPTDKDWVRFLIGDTGPTFSLEDETIDQVLIEENTNVDGSGPWSKYLAAYTAGQAIIALGGDVVRKKVDGLEIDTAAGDPESAYRQRLDSLRAKGNELLMPKPRAFRVL